MTVWMAILCSAWAVDTGEEPADPEDTATEMVDDDNEGCDDCKTASELAGDPGGGPCGSGCATSSGTPAAAALLLLAVAARRRR
ncbi:MAG: hypothetical protein KTR31_00065 [Myxococcales bacterium]|nr:hypothetical protein [Myxococcales bacterium]